MTAIVLVIALAIPTGATTHHDLCDPYQRIVDGTAADDTYTVGPAGTPTCYDGLEGNDTTTGGEGPDNVLGSSGDDVLSGGPGDNGDDLHGGGGADQIDGRSGDDIAYGGTGDDTLYGHGGSDALFGGGFCHETGYYGFELGTADPANLAAVPCGTGGTDHLYGGDGNDYLWESNSDTTSDGAPDVIDGGPGVDFCAIGPEDTASHCETIEHLAGPS